MRPPWQTTSRFGIGIGLVLALALALDGSCGGKFALTLEMHNCATSRFGLVLVLALALDGWKLFVVVNLH